MKCYLLALVVGIFLFNDQSYAGNFTFSRQGSDTIASAAEVDGFEGLLSEHMGKQQINMPGLGKVGSVILRGVSFANSEECNKLFSEVSMNTITRETYTISTENVVLTLFNAWITKIGTDSIECKDTPLLEVAFEHLSIK